MNRYTQSKDNLTLKQVKNELYSYACFSSVNAMFGGFCYYQIKKYLPDEINKWLLALAATLFDFEVFEENDEEIIIKLAVGKHHTSNLAKLTLFRYIDRNEKQNTNLEPAIKKAFASKGKYGDFYALVMANLTDGYSADGHSICESTNTIGNAKRTSTPILISLEECKKRINSGESSSVFRSYTDNRVDFKWTNEEDYWKLVSANL